MLTTTWMKDMCWLCCPVSSANVFTTSLFTLAGLTGHSSDLAWDITGSVYLAVCTRCLSEILYTVLSELIINTEVQLLNKSLVNTLDFWTLEKSRYSCCYKWFQWYLAVITQSDLKVRSFWCSVHYAKFSIYIFTAWSQLLWYLSSI